VRYWAIRGLVNRCRDDKCHAALVAALKDDAPAVRITAAEALAADENGDQGLTVLAAAIKSDDEWARLMAANSLDRLDERAAPLRADLNSVLDSDRNEYVRRVLTDALGKHHDR